MKEILKSGVIALCILVVFGAAVYGITWGLFLVGPDIAGLIAVCFAFGTLFCILWFVIHCEKQRVIEQNRRDEDKPTSIF